MKALLFAAALLSTAPAFAQETAQSFDWTGLYAGISTGSGSFQAAATKINGRQATAVHLSKLIDSGNFVYGAELAYQRGSATASVNTDTVTLKGMAGYSVGRVLAYATAGFGRTKVDAGGTIVTDNVLAYGIGARYAATDRVSVGLENAVSTSSSFGPFGAKFQSNIWSLRVDYRF